MNVEHFADGVLIERTVDHGDGTGVRTVYDDKGNVTSTEQVDGLPIVDIDIDREVGAQVSDLSAQLAAQNATIEALLNALGGTP